jgi:hypothetical protein
MDREPESPGILVVCQGSVVRVFEKKSKVVHRRRLKCGTLALNFECILVVVHEVSCIPNPFPSTVQHVLLNQRSVSLQERGSSRTRLLGPIKIRVEKRRGRGLTDGATGRIESEREGEIMLASRQETRFPPGLFRTKIEIRAKP